VRKGFHAPYSNHGHNEGLAGDGLSEWHLSFVQLAATLEGCARRYAQDSAGATGHGASRPANRAAVRATGFEPATSCSLSPQQRKADPSAGLDSRTEVTAVTGF
jgi:putative transposase